LPTGGQTKIFNGEVRMKIGVWWEGLVWMALALLLMNVAVNLWVNAFILPELPQVVLDAPDLIDHHNASATEIQLPGPIQFTKMVCGLHTSRFGLVSECLSPTLIVEVLYK
jgi:hypothetical protein